MGSQSSSRRATFLAFVGLKGLWEIMDPHDKRSEGLAYPLTSSFSFFFSSPPVFD
jgi:hypothetical protein